MRDCAIMVRTSEVVPLRQGEAGSPDRLTLTVRGPRDPRLVDLVRLLARQAADAYFDAAMAKREDDATK